eukprot:TRINITY_DN72138_c0_g1_i1.p1 TRINITY_DN72138_c0_g1~~TRINITY_DN72138_c0_g1_i1.p1  ORF type:complete len:418 (-),score=90.19 TRINITY_DN72138_c0_g1_i1:341-1594(-)
MALYDRRLLAYCDNGSFNVGHRLTMLDRMTEYQRDLAEIDRELCKYQLVLGSHHVRFKPRGREAWLTDCRKTKTLKDRFRAASRTFHDEHDEHESTVVTQKPAAASASASQRHVHAAAAEAGRGEEISAVAAGGGGLATAGGRRLSATKRTSVGQDAVHKTWSERERARAAAGVSSLESAAHQPRSAATSVLAQIDTIFGLRRVAGAEASYSVEVSWKDAPEGRKLVTEPCAGKAAGPGVDDCVVRQQLRLEGLRPGSRHVVLLAVRARSKLVGTCQLDSSDDSTHDVAMHQLLDGSQRPTGAAVKMRLQFHDAGAAGGGLGGMASRPSQEAADGMLPSPVMPGSAASSSVADSPLDRSALSPASESAALPAVFGAPGRDFQGDEHTVEEVEYIEVEEGEEEEEDVEEEEVEDSEAE